jgi:Putative Actinobacterial Holin-X, holin superfamily III
MVSDPQTVAKPSLISLARGIVDDAKQLAIAHFEFRKYQTLQQVVRAKTMAVWIVVGAAFAGTGFLLLTLMAVHLLNTFLNVTLWGSYGLVGLALLLLGCACLYGVRNRQ